MAYFGCQFVFDDIPSWEYGLVIYDLGGPNEDGDFTSPAEIVEDRISRRYTPLHYGVTRNEPLKFELHFGVDPRAVDKRQWLDRWEMDAIASWLTEHTDYKYLEIFQQDLDVIRYKCIITNLTYSSYGKYPWAFTAEVTCDSPYAYLYPETYSYNLSSPSANPSVSLTERLLSKQSPIHFCPDLDITLLNAKSISIINQSDDDRAFTLTGLPARQLHIKVDNENEVLTLVDSGGAADTSLKLYSMFNLNFFRLVRGYNNLMMTIERNTSSAFSARVDLICEFPINPGG